MKSGCWLIMIQRSHWSHVNALNNCVTWKEAFSLSLPGKSPTKIDKLLFVSKCKSVRFWIYDTKKAKQIIFYSFLIHFLTLMAFEYFILFIFSIKMIMIIIIHTYIHVYLYVFIYIFIYLQRSPKLKQKYIIF